ncbi:MAG: hypothetical protein CVV47_13465 [Spirochaetae bacterium HGW-Spirochaetae-3]|nr:MAG: hypothetical protein CVV47_13465 [Spirochaetae bacterium HGW-Spirochaetae-3]
MSRKNRKPKFTNSGTLLSVTIPANQSGMDAIMPFFQMLEQAGVYTNEELDSRTLSNRKERIEIVRWIQLRKCFHEVFVTNETRDGLTRVIWDGQKTDERWIDLSALYASGQINFEGKPTLNLLPPRGWEFD